MPEDTSSTTRFEPAPFGKLLRSTADIFASVGGTSDLVSNVFRVAAQEQRYWSEYPISARSRLYAWRHGFTSRDYVLLELSENDPEDYLSYLQQARLVHPAINEEYHDVLRNKLAFYRLSRPYVDCIPDVYGTISDGEFTSSVDEPDHESLSAVVDAAGDVIVKPVTGTMGREVYRIAPAAEGYTVNGSHRSAAELSTLADGLDRFLVSEFVEQHRYAARICPDSTNTIRALTVEDPETGAFFVASAVHRFGNASTGPTDNWSGGGFAAPVDIGTGRLGELRTYAPETGLRRLEEHPDSGAPVAGEQVPDWERLKSTVTDLAAVHREIPYVGWDLVLSEDGPVVLEGNAAPHLALQQLGHGLFEDDRVKRFFEHYTG